MPGAAGIIAGVVALAVSATALTAVAVSAASEYLATVVRVVDGDTLDVRLNGEQMRVRLLNVDTPETVDPGEPVQCLGPEATAFLTEQLPAGSTVRLAYDGERIDRYGRVLAGVYRGSELVNASIARAGLGVAVVVRGNNRFLSAVEAAEQEARTNGVGLHAIDIACTVPAQVESATAAAAQALAAVPGDDAGLEQLGHHAERLAAATAPLAAAASLLDGDHRVWPPIATDVPVLRSRLEAAAAALVAAQAKNTAAVSAEQQRLEAERLAAEAAEQARMAEEARVAEAARLAEEARIAEARRVEQQAAAARAAASTAGGANASQGSSSGSGGGADTYTGCRAYAPGGRTYTKIDCTTKQPIG